jgi:hypothetical protein
MSRIGSKAQYTPDAVNIKNTTITQVPATECRPHRKERPFMRRSNVSQVRQSHTRRGQRRYRPLSASPIRQNASVPLTILPGSRGSSRKRCSCSTHSKKSSPASSGSSAPV